MTLLFITKVVPKRYEEDVSYLLWTEDISVKKKICSGCHSENAVFVWL